MNSLDRRLLPSLVAVLWLGCLTNYAGAKKVHSDEEKLLDYLFKNYNPSARPVLNSSKTVTVGLRFALLQIQDLNVRSQVFTTTGLLLLDWKDERLSWSKEISSLDNIVIDGKSIWKPEFAVINGAEGIYEDFSDFQAVLKSDGSIHWEPGGVFKTMCNIDITYYPFDTQTCSLQFGAWSYYTTKMNLTTNDTTVGMESYEKNGEWEITGTAVGRHEFFFDCCPDERFSNILFSIDLRRRHTFYIMNVILPGIMTSAVLLSIFFCTPSQKVHIGVAALLSFRLFLLNVADTIPRTSDHVPLLGIYLTSTMAITTLAMVATVFVLNLYGMKEKPVPPWAKRVFVGYLARILCMCDCVSPPPVDKGSAKEDLELQCTRYTHSNPYVLTQQTRYGYTGKTTKSAGTHPQTQSGGQAAAKTKYRLISTQDNEHILEEDETKIDGISDVTTNDVTQSHDPYQSRDYQNFRGMPSSSSAGRRDMSQQQQQHEQCSMGDNTRYSRRVSDNTRFSTKNGPRDSTVSHFGKKDYSKEWVHVAAVCDRLFFWFCFLFIAITTLLLFHPLTTSRYFQIPGLEKAPTAG